MDEILSVTIQIKVIEQIFPMVLLIMLYDLGGSNVRVCGAANPKYEHSDDS